MGLRFKSLINDGEDAIVIARSSTPTTRHDAPAAKDLESDQDPLPSLPRAYIR